MKKRILFFVFICIILTGCSYSAFSNNTETDNNQSANTGFVAAKVGTYDSADTAVISKIVTADKKITFLNIMTGKKYTLEYDGTTYFYDKYGEHLSQEQLSVGEVVDVTFLKSKKKCVILQISKDTWTYGGIDNFEINTSGKGLAIGKEQYQFLDEMIIVSDGELAELMDLNQRDTLKLRGKDRTIYSIEIERGHGYLRLKNDEYFIDGWIEIGQSIIQKITEDMLITVPEGKYQVIISNKGGGGTKEIKVDRNEEIELDIGDLKGEEIKLGNVVFTTTPTSAEVFVDGDKVDRNSKVTLEYGVHQLIVKAEGYDTISQYFKVGQPNANLDISMEETQEIESTEGVEEGADAVSGNNAVSGNDSVTGKPSVSGNDTATADSEGAPKAKINAPSGVEVYVDGKYIGISPVSFKKEEGTHVVILRKSGYKTRSYTIQITGGDKEENWSFADLVKTKTEEEE